MSMLSSFLTHAFGRANYEQIKAAVTAELILLADQRIRDYLPKRLAKAGVAADDARLITEAVIARVQGAVGA